MHQGLDIADREIAQGRHGTALSGMIYL
jgi:hypothetical protein